MSLGHINGYLFSQIVGIQIHIMQELIGDVNECILRPGVEPIDGC